jgi:hypothetical protein
MNDVLQPEWLANHVPALNTGNPNWKKGVSGNPKGRPPGKTATQKVQSALNEGSLDVAKKVLEQALAGDMQAAAMVMARVSPALRSQLQCVQFDFDPELPIAKQVEQVLAAVATGQVSPDLGQTIVAMISNLANVRATEELEQRLLILEAKAVNE